MANIKSAIRRIKTAHRNAIQNKKYLSTVKTFTKKYLILLDSFKNKQQPKQKPGRKLQTYSSKQHCNAGFWER
jgi:small subunit ribosomal protein S20